MTTRTRPSGFNVVARAARSALQWRLLVLWTACLLLPTAVAALPVWQLLGANLDYSVHAASLAQALDLSAISDLLLSQMHGGPALANASILALISTLLLSPLLSGFVVSAARASATPGFRELMAGGLREYPRLLRMLIWAVLPVGSAAVLGGAVLEAADKYGRTVTLESDAQMALMAAALVLGLLVMLANATLEAGRARLALDRRRGSAVKAWWEGCVALARRPLAMLGAYFGISALGLAVAALLAYARINLPPLGVAGFAGAFALTQAVVLVMAWMRSARLFAMIDLARPHAA